MLGQIIKNISIIPIFFLLVACSPENNFEPVVNDGSYGGDGGHIHRNK
ncbi:Uncharacterised protein [Legionella beliardensis]|uniref:Lipoprotein n=1 Tax=Legionella beliardensis TaxID=91822 RepID=A0A378JSS4_9GAMM|nr:hypothetical protein [Legionella beliardensis]STX55723.1 Uncharacterised protein [Legionella beliardensis]